MTTKKDQHIKELQDLLAASRARVVLLNKDVDRLRSALETIINIVDDAK